jgi:hypothetical protein
MILGDATKMNYEKDQKSNHMVNIASKVSYQYISLELDTGMGLAQGHRIAPDQEEETRKTRRTIEISQDQPGVAFIKIMTTTIYVALLPVLREKNRTVSIALKISCRFISQKPGMAMGLAQGHRIAPDQEEETKMKYTTILTHGRRKMTSTEWRDVTDKIRKTSSLHSPMRLQLLSRILERGRPQRLMVNIASTTQNLKTRYHLSLSATRMAITHTTISCQWISPNTHRTMVHNRHLQNNQDREEWLPPGHKSQTMLTQSKLTDAKSAKNTCHQR